MPRLDLLHLHADLRPDATHVHPLRHRRHRGSMRQDLPRIQLCCRLKTKNRSPSNSMVLRSPTTIRSTATASSIHRPRLRFETANVLHGLVCTTGKISAKIVNKNKEKLKQQRSGLGAGEDLLRHVPATPTTTGPSRPTKEQVQQTREEQETVSSPSYEENSCVRL